MENEQSGDRLVDGPTSVGRTALCAFSPTWWYADCRKAPLDEAGATAFIKGRNTLYLRVSLGLTAIFLALSWNDVAEIQTPNAPWTWVLAIVFILKFALGWYLLSRCNEVFYAFYRDAADKLRPGRPARSDLDWGDRVQLALKSYAELILNFALLYAMLPCSAWQEGYRIHNFTDALSYSATTITTSGGGGFVASCWFLQALTAYEIACGLILLVVCFTVYVGHALAEFPEERYARRRARKVGAATAERPRTTD